MKTAAAAWVATIAFACNAGVLAQHSVRMSQLVHMTLDDRTGRHVGEVEDLLVDTSDGRVAYAIVDVGGWLGLGEHRAAVPLERVRAKIEHGHAVIDMSERELRALPSYRRDDPPDGDDDRRFRSAEKLLRANVRDGLRHDVGDVRDFLVDLDSGSIRYGVVRFTPSFFRRGRPVLVPFDRLGILADDDDLVVRATEAELRRAPTFEPGRLRPAARG